MSTGLGTGEPICAICGTPFDSHLKCRNGHPLFKAQDIVLEVPINRETLLADEPLGVRETGHSTSDELFKNVHYERTKTNYETIKTKTPICLSQRETSRRDFTFGGIATAVIGGAIGGPIGEAVFDERKEARAASITEQELIDFQGTEHDREKLAGWLENLEKDKGKPSLQGLIRSQIAILDGSNLRKLEMPARLLADSQSGAARATTFIQYMKILHLTGRPGDVVKKISAAINNFVPGERCELYWQLISSNVAALEKEDIFQAPQSFQGTVKSYADSIDAAFEFLFPTLNLHDRAEYQENPSQALSLLSRLPGTREQRLALNAIQGTVYLNIMRNQRGGQAQLEEAIRVAQSHEKVAPRHGWNVLSVVAGLYWYLNQLEDALQISNTANDYLGEYGDEEMRRYAKYQSLQKGTEFIIFASTRARLLFEKALREKKEKTRWMNECRKMCQQLLLAQPTIGGLGSIERARQYILADVWLEGGHETSALTRFALGKAVKPMSHVLYGAMPSPTAVERMERVLDTRREKSKARGPAKGKHRPQKGKHRPKKPASAGGA